MKKDIHQEMHKVIFRDTAANTDFVSLSTRKSDVVEKIDGEDYFVINVDVSSASHPFFTGQDNIVDIAGRVERFKNRANKKTSKKEVDSKK